MTLVATIELPWPPPALSPNGGVGWRRRHKAAQEYLYCCHCAVLAMRPRPRITDLRGLELQLVFSRPTRRECDRDNLVARVKSGIDGMCRGLGFDDKAFRRVSGEVADEVVAGGRVVAYIRRQVTT